MFRFCPVIFRPAVAPCIDASYQCRETSGRPGNGSRNRQTSPAAYTSSTLVSMSRRTRIPLSVSISDRRRNSLLGMTPVHTMQKSQGRTLSDPVRTSTTLTKSPIISFTVSPSIKSIFASRMAFSTIPPAAESIIGYPT